MASHITRPVYSIHGDSASIVDGLVGLLGDSPIDQRIGRLALTPASSPPAAQPLSQPRLVCKPLVILTNALPCYALLPHIASEPPNTNNVSEDRRLTT